MKRILCWATVLVLSCGMNQAWASVGASGGDGPSTSTDYNGGPNGFSITGDVLYDPSAGPWEKHLLVGSGVESGLLVPLTETLTNVGTQAWTDWHEEIIGPIEVITPFGSTTTFAFERDSVDVYRNGDLLTEGSDYSLQFTLHAVVQPNMNPPGHADQGQHWQSVSILFDPSASIQPNDTLTITKNIFETYLNGSTWSPMVVPVIAEYPTIPEPTTLVYLLTAVVAIGAGRARGISARR